LRPLFRASMVIPSDSSMILSLAQRLQATSFLSYIRMSAYGFPVVLSLHMVVILLFGGMVLMTDMRILGFALRRYPISVVIEGLRLPKRYALLTMLTLGFLLFGSKATEYLGNIFFRTKITLLCLIGVHYLVFRKGVYNRTADFDGAPSAPARAKLAAASSLVLWTSVIIAGRSIGYTPLSTTPVPSSGIYTVPIVSVAGVPPNTSSAARDFKAFLEMDRNLAGGI
jgi:hypothetical protein